MFEDLLSPIKIGNVEIKNRMSTAAMEMLLCDDENKVTQKYLDYVEARAKGGFGLIISEANAAIKGSGAFERCSAMYSDDLIEGQSKVAEVVHKHGAKMALQLIHIGRQAETKYTGTALKAPSPIKDPVMEEVPEELSIDEIKDIIEGYGEAALRAKKAGFDMVEIMASHGYLIQEFLSPYTNKRTDIYGGSLQNRAKLSLEILKSVKEKCGNDFPVIWRFSMVEYIPDGLDISETRAYARLLEEAGADALHATHGVWSMNRIMFAPAAIASGPCADNAAEIKKVVSIPVINVCRYTDPYVADSNIKSGKADIIAFARQSLADPDFPNKVMNGEIDCIRHCIGCIQGCLGKPGVRGLYDHQPTGCLVNPMVGFEGKYTFEEAEEKKKVMIVGGGLAGMYAAYAAAKRGHDVTIYDSADRLGGQWLLAAVPPHKQALTTTVCWLKKEFEKYDVKQVLNTKVDKAMIENEKPDAVILAIGSNPVVPRIDGVENVNVITAKDVLGFKVNVGDNVVVIGGGQVGAETAAYIGQMNKKATILEMMDDICVDAMDASKYYLVEYLKEKNIDIITSAKVTNVAKDSVTYEKDGKTCVVEQVSDIVVAVGSRSNKELEIDIEGIKVIYVGDADSIGDGYAATHSGFEAGYYI